MLFVFDGRLDHFCMMNIRNQANDKIVLSNRGFKLDFVAHVESDSVGVWFSSDQCSDDFNSAGGFVYSFMFLSWVDIIDRYDEKTEI